MGNNGNGASSLIILALPLLLLGWMFWSANRRQKQMRAFSSSLVVGDAVVTTSGIFGTITELDDTTVALEVSPGTTIRFDRRALAAKQPVAASEQDDATEGTPGSPQSGQ